MYLRRFYDEKLAHASYLVGCARSGSALVVDPGRDIEPYLEEARRKGFTITHAAETHIHADFVSGTLELAERVGATMLLSDQGDESWKYAFADRPDARPVRDGEVVEVGTLRLDVLATPGHTPEHVAFMLTDTAAADRPMGVFTGDFLFVGDVGRPDLLETAVRVEGAAELGARQLFRSLRRFAALPDWLQIWPAHGAGSACGKALGDVPQSTLGYEKLFNWAFRHRDEDAFVREALADQPDPPRYFVEVKRINRAGPPASGGARLPRRLPDERLAALLEQGATVVDTRSAGAFARGHMPGTLSIPLNRSFTTWAGWLLPYGQDLHLIVEGGEARVGEAVGDLASIGLDRVAGYFDASAASGGAGARPPLEALPQIDTTELAERLAGGQELVVLDVRGADEWRAGHIPGVPNLPLGHLPDRLEELPRGRPIAVHCQAGGRSAIAASLLRAAGLSDVVNVRGGFGAWAAAGHPVERAPGASEAPAEATA